MPVVAGKVVHFFAGESLTVGAGTQSLTASVYAPTGTLASIFGGGTYAEVTVEDDQIRTWFDDGVTTTPRVLVNPGAVLYLYSLRDIQNFRATRVTGDAIIRASYARRRY